MSRDRVARGGRSLLDVDGELAAAVPARERGRAREALTGEAFTLPAGPATAALGGLAAEDGVWGFFIASGVVLHGVTLGRASVLELVGAGELLGPPVRLASVVRPEPHHAVVEQAEVIVLQDAVAAALSRWPAAVSILARRMSRQRLRATTLGAIAHLPRVDVRILAALWHLAETWGRPAAGGGTVIPFPFTHARLGTLVAAKRPTVTLAVRRLEEHGLLRRLGDGTWLLPPGSEDALRDLLPPAAAAPAVGPRPGAAPAG